MFGGSRFGSLGPLGFGVTLAVAIGSCKADGPDDQSSGGGKPVDVAAGRADAGATAGPAPSANAGAVVVSEIMYNPVLENAYEDEHEFVELHNRSAKDVGVGGWQLAGDVAFTFPSGTSIKAGGFLVVAKKKAALLAVKEYGLVAASVLGDYAGALDNGRGKLRLLDGAGGLVESVEYRDELPWPVAADALGAGERWLPPEQLPLAKHQFRGRSLERIDFAAPASDAASWEASALDGATPGKANGAQGPARAIVERIEVVPVAGEGPVRAGGEALVKVGFSKPSAIVAAQLEFFRDDLEVADEKTATVPLARRGDGFEAKLPAQPEGSVVRYRVWVDRGGMKSERISPRPSDPYEWHAYFVEPTSAAKARTYHLFISRRGWGQLWDNLQEGPVKGCKENPDRAKPTENLCGPDKCEISAKWNDTVPAVFVHAGKVYDVHARYQGSRHNRRTGPSIGDWPHPGPVSAEPMDPFRALSFSLKFPRYREFEGKDTLSLNKLTPNVCLGLDSAVGVRLYAAVGLPMLAPRFVRLNVNGGYYHYMMEWQQTPETMVRDFWKREPVGDLYEAKGYLRDEGPYGVSDARLFEPYCSYTARQRYEATYDKKSNEWRGHGDLVAMIEALHKARGEGREAMRAYFAKHWDVDALLTYVAVRNWSAAWDDSYHNHFLYQRRSDGKWLMLPWDVDNEFNGRKSTTSMRTPVEYTFYIGSEADKNHKGVTHPVTNELMWNRVKDTLFQAMRPEFNQRLLDLAAKQLGTDAIAKIVDEAVADISLEDAMAAPAWGYKDKDGKTPAQCNLADRAKSIKDFARDRNARLPAALME